MLFLAHTGITLGAAAIVAGLSTSRPARRSSQSISSRLGYPFRITSQGLTALGRLVDTRLLLIAALLPDIIDKPLGLLLLKETLNSGRIFGHTLLFVTFTAALGLYLYRRRNRTWLLVLSFGTLMHLILDQMWLAPETLFWPFSGSGFEGSGTTDWLSGIFHTLVTNPGVYIAEVVGAVIIAWFLLLQRGNIYALIRYGRA
jgi:membrane-bound metal-dependent hydrolase YbcI (DUF457 family)